MSLAVHTSTQLFSQITSKLDSGNVYQQRYLDDLKFVKSIEASSGQDNPNTAQSIAGLTKPGSRVFADMTGVSENDAVEIIHGVVGSNTDTRDWAAIMASDDPLTAARQATAEMYGVPSTGSAIVSSNNAATRTQRTQAGNFAVDVTTTASTLASYGGSSVVADAGTTKQAGLYLIDGKSSTLRLAGNTPEAVSHNAWLFGFDKAPLTALAEAIQSIEPELSAMMQKATTAPANPLAGTAVAAAVVASTPASSTATPSVASGSTAPANSAGSSGTGSASGTASGSVDTSGARVAQALLDLLNSLKGVTT